ncbi:MAG: hypothetical protein LBO80_11560 [Treponema sp.]|nr:hypothetical protein [Treponema sp.]
MAIKKSVQWMRIAEEKPVKIWTKDLGFSVMVFRQIFRNKDGTVGERFLVTNDFSLTGDKIKILYKKWWKVEEYHKSLKQNASIRNSPAHQERTQSNHVFIVVFEYVKLEMLKLTTGRNYFALKTKVSMALLQTSMITFQIYNLLLSHKVGYYV